MSSLPPTYSAYVPPPRYVPGMCQQFQAGERFGAAWRLFWDNWGAVAGPCLLALVIQIVAGMIPILGSFAGLFLGPLMTAATFQVIRVARGEPGRAGDIFQVFGPKYWPVFVMTLLYTLCCSVGVIPAIIGVVLAILGSGVGGPGGAAIIAVGVALIIVGWIAIAYIQARLCHAPILMYDAPLNSLEIMECLRLSWNRTAPFGWSVLGLLLLAGLVAMASILLLGVGIFLVGIPFVVAVQAVAYLALFPNSRETCTTCGYDLRGIPSGHCPECGKISTPAIPSVPPSAPPAGA